MGVRTNDIFGAAAGAPAVPGSYGEAPTGYRLPAETSLGAVRLQIADLDQSLAWYRDVLGLREVARSADGVVLAAHGDDAPLVELVPVAGTRRARQGGRLGLFHFAILLPDRASLGAFVRHLGEVGVNAGAGDHLVSEAFYLTDPDGLGIEVYADRPRSTWRRNGRELMMATDPVDVGDLLQAAASTEWTGMPRGTVMGHVHLHVGDVGQAAAFYSDVIGFDRTVWSYPGALFLGAGGYHHHLGANTWAGPGATPSNADEARLLEWTMVLPDESDVNDLAASLRTAGHRVEGDGGQVLTADPWQTALRVRARGPTTG